MITFDEAKTLIDYTLIKITGNICVFILMIAAIVIAILHACEKK